MEKFKKKPFAIIGVNVLDHDPVKLKKVMIREQLNWRSFSNKNDITNQWNTPETPSYYIIDHEGRIRHKWTGNPGGRSLDLILGKMIKEAEKTKTPKLNYQILEQESNREKAPNVS